MVKCPEVNQSRSVETNNADSIEPLTQCFELPFEIAAISRCRFVGEARRIGDTASSLNGRPPPRTVLSLASCSVRLILTKREQLGLMKPP